MRWKQRGHGPAAGGRQLRYRSAGERLRGGGLPGEPRCSPHGAGRAGCGQRARLRPARRERVWDEPGSGSWAELSPFHSTGHRAGATGFPLQTSTLTDGTSPDWSPHLQQSSCRGAFSIPQNMACAGSTEGRASPDEHTARWPGSPCVSVLCCTSLTGGRKPGSICHLSCGTCSTATVWA